MKFILLPLLLLITVQSALSQKFRVSAPPVDGYFFMDTVCKNGQPPIGCSNKCIDIICETGTVYSSAEGKVLYCYSHSNRTYEIGIKYGSSVVVYYNIKKKMVQRSQPVKNHMVIGELPQNPKDNLYHLGLQVIETPNRFLWFNSLLAYLDARLIAN